jgi:DNA-binding NtrC family response regulator
METESLKGLSILVVEDELLWRKQIIAGLERLGADVTAASDLQAATRLIENLAFDLALVDVNLPDGLGTDLLRHRRFSGGVPVVVMTAQGGVAGAVQAMRLGAADYLAKPFDPAELSLVFGRVLRSRRSARLEEHRLKESSGGEFYFGTALAPLQAQLQKIIASDFRMQTQLAPVLIQGETGTGKTTVARWLHRRGPRTDQALVEVNCSALPETLAESELFGHERGAFTDARSVRLGLFEAASGGTLFLDELPSLSLAMQAKVLVAIEDRKIRRIGGNKEIPVDVRVVAAASRDLKSLVAQGSFREDLYHRLDLFRLALPTLRERGNDIVRLAESLLARLCDRYRLPRKSIAPEGSRRLQAYAWPGNVRELAHELERAVVFEESSVLSFDQLNVPADPATSAPVSGDDWFNQAYVFPETGFSMDAATQRLIQHAMKQSKQNVSAAARLLGVSRDYLRYRLPGGKDSEGERS